MRDATFGAIALAALTSLFVYYTVWALVTPLIDAGHPVLAYFPKHSDAVAWPGFAGVVVTFVSFFLIGAAMLAHAPVAKAKRA